jgi:glyoxylase-like metal-dependent hydrolase (beta-lactamase superfamily II)
MLLSRWEGLPTGPPNRNAETTRVSFSLIRSAALLALTAACGVTGPAGSARPATTPDASAAFVEDVHFIEGTFDTSIGPDGNTVIFSAPRGLVVVDAGRHRTHSQKILDYASERGVPITTIINTHWHLDHSTGNQDLEAVYPAARLYTTRAVVRALDGFLARSSARTAERLLDPDLPQADRARLARGFNTIRGRTTLIPDVPVERTMTLPVSGRDIELHATHYAVTESDVWIWDPATRTVIAGDIVTLPVPLFDTGCPFGWLAAFDSIETKPYDRVIPGHGYPMSREEFRVYHSAFENLMSCAETSTGAACADGWLRDAAALLDKEPDKDFADREYAKAAAAYYVDQIIRSAEMRAEFCSG